MMRAVPIVGSKAAWPGKGVAPENVTAAARTPSMPDHPITNRQRGGTRATVVAPTASEAPSASSHARVKDEKYAAGGSACVRCTDHANEAAAMTTTRTSARLRPVAAAPRREADRSAG